MMNERIRRIVIFSCLLLGVLSLGHNLLAQSTGASIVGIVHDKTGAVVGEASISMTNTATNERTNQKSNDKGEYTVLDLVPGTYTLDVSAPGFVSYEQKGIKLEVSQHATQDIALDLGQVSQTVTVDADVSGVDTTSAQLNDEISGTSLRELPLNTRNPYALLALVPGYNGSFGNDYNSIGFSVNGTRTGYFDTLVDGTPASFPTVNGYTGIGVFPSIDAIGEYRVLGDNYPAEFGRATGGIANVVFKSGTNQFHGTVFEFLRNSVFDANDYFSNLNHNPLPLFHRNQFGGVFDGPIYRDKTFFLVSTELLRQNQFTSTNTTVPTVAQRSGDFSQTYGANGNLIQLYNPFTTRLNPNYGMPGQSKYIRDPFQGNIIPTSLMSKVAQNVLKYYPLPTSNGNSVTHANNYFATGSTVTQTTAWDVRIDHSISDRQKIFGRYSNRYYSSAPNPLFPKEDAVAEGLINGEDFARSLAIGYTGTVNSNTIFQANLGFTRTLYNYLNNSLGFSASDLGLPDSLNAAGGVKLFPVFNASGYVGLGNTGYRHNAFMTYSLLSSLTMVRGSHTIKFGFDGRLIRVNDNESSSPAGSFSFGTNFTQGPDPQTANANAGNGLASMLLGTGTGSMNIQYKDDAAQSYYFAEYLQDDWRVNPKLTLNLGLRYDLDTPRTERFNRANYFDPNVVSPLSSVVPGLQGGLIFVGTPGHSRHQFNMDTNNLAPRLGFSYAATPRTVVHGAGGIVYGPSTQAAVGTTGQYGFNSTTTWSSTVGNDGITPSNNLDNPFPSGYVQPTGSSLGLLTAVGGPIQVPIRNTPTGYSIQYHLDVQQSLSQETTFDIAYVGSRSLKQTQSGAGGIDYDQLPTSDLSYGSSLADKVPNPYYGQINVSPFNSPTIARSQMLRKYSQFTNVQPLYMSGGRTQYDALQTRMNRRMGHGLQLQISYVWSKSYDNGTNHQDSFNPMKDWAVSSGDVRNRFIASYIYQLPVGRGRLLGSNIPAWEDAVIGGWQVNGITTLQSGTPLQVTANNVSGLGNPVEYANWDGRNATLHTDIHTRLNKYFDTTHFAQPAAYTLGNGPAYYDGMRGPGLASTDFSLYKEFSTVERLKLQFRAEAFNVFNHVQFANPNTSVTSTSFGAITSQSNSPRQLQFGLKLLF